jgi:retron-type reverse transcriptase
VVGNKNLMKAYRRVVGNKGAAGVDEMTVEELKPYLKTEWPKIKEQLLEDRYKPQPVRRVEIPKQMRKRNEFVRHFYVASRHAGERVMASVR